MNRFQTVQREEKAVCKASFGRGLLSQICPQAIACMFTVDENVDRVHDIALFVESKEAKFRVSLGLQNQDEMPKAAGVQMFVQV